MSSASKKDEKKSNSGKHGRKVSFHDTREPRKPSDFELESLVEDYPPLANNPNVVRITAEDDETYNCLAWALGETDEWIQESQVSEVRDILLQRGYMETAKPGGVDGEIDIWSTDDSGRNFAHATVKYKGLMVKGMENNLWESKCSESFRFTHGRFDITCKSYNKVAASFKKKPG